MADAPPATVTEDLAPPALPGLSDSLPKSQHMTLIPVVDADASLENSNPEENVLVISANRKSKVLINRKGLLRFVNSFKLMSQAMSNNNTDAASSNPLPEWQLADPITATSQNLSYLASWINYYNHSSNKEEEGNHRQHHQDRARIPTCVTYPIFLGPPDYVIEPADYLFIENIILEGKGLGEKRIMKLISLGEFCAAIDCGVLRDIVSGYIAAKIREADEAFVEGVGKSADVVVRGWFGKEGGLSDKEFFEAGKKFGGIDSEKDRKNRAEHEKDDEDKIVFGRDWQEHDRTARASQKAAGILPMQPYE